MKKYLSINDVISMSEEELSQVHSETKKNGQERCSTIGMTDVMIKRHERDLFVLTWSEEHGDPQIIASLKEEIRDLENDNFSFSLFVKSK